MADNPEALINKALSAPSPEEKFGLLASFRSMPCEEPTLFNRAGVIYYQLGNVAEASQCFLQATMLNPNYLSALVNLGACYNEDNDQRAAIRCYQQALTLDENNIDTWSNLGKAYNDCQEFEMAAYCLKQAEELCTKSNTPRKLVNVLLGLTRAYHQGGRDDRALRMLERVLTLDPQNVHAHHNLASIYFHLEDYPNAVKEFEWRLQLPSMDTLRQNRPQIFVKPVYEGGPLAGKTLLLFTEQGFGDSIQFARFINLLRPKVGKLVMWCREGLGELFRHSLDVDVITEDHRQLPDFDMHFSLLSIPRYFDPALGSLGAFSPYLSAPGSTGFNLSPLHGKKIGLAWGADKAGYDYANKTVPLKLLAPLFQLPNTHWFSLQVGSESRDIQNLGLSHMIEDLSPRLKSFANTADAIAQLDLVITTDTSVAHLAGAMGKPVWVMLKKQPDWRWNDRATTPWYPTARLFRQGSHGDWSLVIKRLQEALFEPLATNDAAKP